MASHTPNLLERRMFVSRRTPDVVTWVLVVGVIGVAGCRRSYEIPTADVRGVVTVNGRAVEGIQVKFVPYAKIRPSVALTDASGRYRAGFTSTQSGVPLGPCVVQFSVYRGESPRNYLPTEFNENASENPAYHIDVPADGLEFHYDIKYDGEIPPYQP